MNKAAIALGSNVGDRETYLAFAVEQLEHILSNMRVSSWYETAPVGVPSQRDFLNGAIIGWTALTPRALLDALLEIERGAGRTRTHAGAPRTLDLDLILFGAEVVNESQLQVPHPRFRERLFVLEPLSEIAGDWIDPETGKSVAELKAVLQSRPPRN